MCANTVALPKQQCAINMSDLQYSRWEMAVNMEIIASMHILLLLHHKSQFKKKPTRNASFAGRGLLKLHSSMWTVMTHICVLASNALHNGGSAGHTSTRCRVQCVDNGARNQYVCLQLRTTFDLCIGSNEKECACMFTHISYKKCMFTHNVIVY